LSIVSLKFFIFIAITLVTYYFCLPKWRWTVMLSASVGFFLANSSFMSFIVFAAMTLAAYSAALGVSFFKNQKIKTLIIRVTIAALVITLLLHKEIPIFLDVPLGISYYTLILIGYLLDVSRGTVKEPQKNPLKLLLFAGYFPQMLSGPFSRYNFMKEDLFNTVKFSIRNVWNGLQRVIWGVFKVLIISTRLSVFVRLVYEAQDLPENPLAGIVFAGGAVLYVFMVYMNFSGSMDIVIGVSEMFGITLAENFQRPFGSANLSEIWRKWHITLGFWLKDYVLYPVLKSVWMNDIRTILKKRFNKKTVQNIPTYIGMFITWFCVGYWHGGSLKFIFGSGLFFFIMILAGLLLKPVFEKIIKTFSINTGSKFWRLFQRVRTFLLFTLSVSFGRMSSLSNGFRIWGRVFFKPNFKGLLNFNVISEYIIRYINWNKDGNMQLFIITFGGLLFVFFVSFLQEKYGRLRSLSGKKWFIMRTAATAAVLLICLRYGGYDESVEFLYGNF